MYKICYYVPDSHLYQTKEALFAAGAGSYKKYKKCSFQSYGIGQFMPQKNASPFIGKINTLESVQEWKVEILCVKSCLQKAIQALKKSHPYESPAFEVFRLYLYGE